MKNILLLSFILLLNACASQSAYRPSDGSGYGYQETKLSDTQYRISFKLRGNNTGKAKDLAMLRAAELTLLAGYDWFEVVDKETLVETKQQDDSSANISHERQVTRDCGLLTCQTRTEPRTTMAATVNFGNGLNQVERSLEIKMGKGIRPQKANIYSANELNQNLSKNKN